MDRPLFLPLALSTDHALVGGKAMGLARLIAAGYRVPAGLCITTAAYLDFLKEAGIENDPEWLIAVRGPKESRAAHLRSTRSKILTHTWPNNLLNQLHAEVTRLGFEGPGLWAVRSSATNEDAARASYAGIYRTHLGVPVYEISRAIQDLWASIWDEHVVAYHERAHSTTASPAMAVVIQPMLGAQAAGVAYSIHPVTGRSHHVVVNAVPGLGASLVDGTATPDQYVVRHDAASGRFTILNRHIAAKRTALRLGLTGVQDELLPQSNEGRSSLTDDELIELARLTTRIERDLRHPVDLEWAIDGSGIWLLQARPVTVVPQSVAFTNEECEWSRANFKETMPDVPSPMGLSFLEHFMEAHIISHYRRLGCQIPNGLSSVRVLHGRPYLNVSLFHNLVGQLRGDPSLNAEQMGGEPLLTAPPVTRLGWFAYIRAGWLMLGELNRVLKSGPGWFAEMKQLASTYHPDRIRSYSREELAAQLDHLGRWLDGREVTFGIAGGVGQCLQAFSLLLPRWLGVDWRNLLNAALQGQGTVISAQQILRLAELVEIARHDHAMSRALLTTGLDLRACSEDVRGSAFWTAFDRYLEDYGHRGVGESDVMSPRFSDQPDALLNVIRVQLRGPASRPDDILARQRGTRTAAMATIRARCGWRLDRWAIFHWWYRRLCRFSALREANRHHLMYYSTAARNLLLRLGDRLVEGGVLTSREDMFFLTLEERQEVVSGDVCDWAAVVRARRADRDRQLTLQVPDTIRDWEDASRVGVKSLAEPSDGVLRGIPISPGLVSGPVRLVRSTADWGKVAAGDIIVAPVIDPGMAPLFGLAAGLMVEMGGTLSHGAIIAREYGLPAVANVTGAMHVLKDGDRIRLDADHGAIHLLQS